MLSCPHPNFYFLLAFDVGGLAFEFCVFVAGWRHALRSEWPFIFLIHICLLLCHLAEPGLGALWSKKPFLCIFVTGLVLWVQLLKSLGEGLTKQAAGFAVAGSLSVAGFCLAACCR